MTRRNRGCRACGICCELYGDDLRASPADLDRWTAQGRSDILASVGAGGRLWVLPGTDTPAGACPFFLRTGPDAALCRIHETKPEVCRGYPTPLHVRCVRGAEG